MVSQLRSATDGDSVLERELAEAGAARARDATEDIEHALQRRDAGTYGSCQGCGLQIGIERLEASCRPDSVLLVVGAAQAGAVSSPLRTQPRWAGPPVPGPLTAKTTRQWS